MRNKLTLENRIERLERILAKEKKLARRDNESFIDKVNKVYVNEEFPGFTREDADLIERELNDSKIAKDNHPGMYDAHLEGDKIVVTYGPDEWGVDETYTILVDPKKRGITNKRVVFTILDKNGNVTGSEIRTLFEIITFIESRVRGKVHYARVRKDKSYDYMSGIIR
jgi:hypothetical protein